MLTAAQMLADLAVLVLALLLAPTAVASSDPALKPGDSLAPNASLTSASGSAWLHNQLDGNLVLRTASNPALWSTGTVDSSCAPQHCQVRLELSADGKLRAVAGNGTMVWTPPGAAASGHATELIVQDCNLVLKEHSTVLWATGTTCKPVQQEPTIGPVNPDYEYASVAAVERWNDLKFGLRIHWGLYSIQGIGQESWPLFANKPAADEAPTIYWMNKLCGPDAAANGTGCQAYEKWYYAQASAWEPKQYDATMWIALMKRAGVKYFDFTAKHCEGFAMYDTAALMRDCWDWDVAGKKPPGIKACDKPYHYSSVEAFGRDIVGELITAARAGGIQPGLYFSHADWADPNLRLDFINPLVQGHVKPGCLGAPCDPRLYNSTTAPEQWRRGVLRHRAQLLEVLTKYGELFELSLDVGLQSEYNTAFNAEMQQTIMEMRAVAPNTLFRQRGIGGTAHSPLQGYGDYNTPEEVFPAAGEPGNWQVIYHGTTYMSFDPVATHYVNGSYIVWHLVDIVAKGGNFQIGYGPDANGQFHPLGVAALEYTGRWLSTNGASIYYTRPLFRPNGTMSWQDAASSQVRYTQSKDNTTVYCTALAGFGAAPTGLELPLADVVPKPGSEIMLLGYEHEGNRTGIPIAWKQSGQNVVLSVPPATELANHPAVMDPGMTFVITIA